MQTVWLMESLVEERQAAIRREVAACRRRGTLVPRAPWRVRLGWRLVEVGLRLALPSPESGSLSVKSGLVKSG